MRISSFSRCALSVSVAVAMLAGCGGSRPELSMPGLAQPAAKAVAWEHRHARMDGALAKWDLLYVSNENGTHQNGSVTVYRYWKRTLVETLTDFKAPEGACVDVAGNVYITDWGANEVVEYAHGGETPIRTLAADSPQSCAVDRRSGDLAIASRKGVSIYRHGEGKPRTHKDKLLSNYHALGYDNDGNLLVTDGCGRGSSPSCQPADFGYLPRRGRSLINISIPGPHGYTYYLHVSAVLWDGKYWVIPAWSAECSLSNGCLTRISIKDSKATYVGTTNLDDFNDPGAVAIYNNDPKEQGTEIAGPPRICV